MYKTMKTHGKIVYIRCTDSTNLLKNLNSLNEKTVNNFLNSEQKIIYAKKRANNDGFACWIPKSL